GRGHRNVPERRYLEFPEVAVLERHVARLERRLTCAILVERPEQVEFAREQLLDAAVAPWIDPAPGDEKRHAGVVEFAVREGRPRVTGAAITFADEDSQATQRRLRIGFHRLRIAARERVAEVVERRAARDERFLERGERLGERDDDLVIRA